MVRLLAQPAECHMSLCKRRGSRDDCVPGIVISVIVRLPEGEVISASTGLAALMCGIDNQGISYFLD